MSDTPAVVEARFEPQASVVVGGGLAALTAASALSLWLAGPDEFPIEAVVLATAYLSAYPQWLLIKSWQAVVITAEAISGPGFPFGRITIPIDHIDLPRSRNGIDIWSRCGTRIRISPAILGRRSCLEMRRLLGLNGSAG